MIEHHSTAGAALSVDEVVLERIANGQHHDPHSVLGPHLFEGNVTVRTLRPLASSVKVITSQGKYAAKHEAHGVWVCVIPGSEVPDYRLEVSYDTKTMVVDDPYRFLPTLGQVDLHLIGEGRHEELWRALGAHRKYFETSLGRVEGVAFAVWAPNARAVRVIGDFNFWDGKTNPMRSLGSSGVWEIFIPDVPVGARYKYEILTHEGHWLQKADPMAQATEVPPATASVVTESIYTWNDENWLSRRSVATPYNQPVSIYECHIGSWKQGLSYREFADQLIPYLLDMGYTHVEFMPIAEHPFGGSWGYQVTSYYAPTARYGVPDDFRYLVDRLHEAGIGVILDWVPAHFPKDEWALARFDGTALYEDPDPQRGEHPDWGTLIFNFGRNEVRNFLVANALYWFEEFHIDGLRVDAVASMLYLDYSRKEGQWHPNQFGGRENIEAISFLQEANATAYRRNKGIMMIAEESTAWPGVTAPTSDGGLGFGFKWNMGWMNDTLRYMKEDPVNRSWHHGELTFSLVYAFSENYVLPLSHDEVVHGKGALLAKMPGDSWQQFANLRCLYAYQWSHPGKKLLFMGQEFAQGTEWSESYSLDWWLLDRPEHRHTAKLVKDLNGLYSSLQALWNDESTGFKWINEGDSSNNVISYIRCNNHTETEEILLCVGNFAGIPYQGYRVGVPKAGGWKEVLNTDDLKYGGSGQTNPEVINAEDIPWDGQPYSITLVAPPLGMSWLRPC